MLCARVNANIKMWTFCYSAVDVNNCLEDIAFSFSSLKCNAWWKTILLSNYGGAEKDTFFYFFRLDCKPGVWYMKNQDIYNPYHAKQLWDFSLDTVGL